MAGDPHIHNQGTVAAGAGLGEEDWHPVWQWVGVGSGTSIRRRNQVTPEKEEEYPQWAWGEIPAVTARLRSGGGSVGLGRGVQSVLLGLEDRAMGGSGREADCRSRKESSFLGVPTVLKWTGSPGPWRRPGLGIGLGTEEEGHPSEAGGRGL